MPSNSVSLGDGVYDVLRNVCGFMKSHLCCYYCSLLNIIFSHVKLPKDEKSGGLCSEEDYPYKARQGKVCMTNCTDVPGSIVKTFIDVPPGKTDALVAAVTLQPISIAIQANQVSLCS